jgi:hypothetical protein
VAQARGQFGNQEAGEDTGEDTADREHLVRGIVNCRSPVLASYETRRQRPHIRTEVFWTFSSSHADKCRDSNLLLVRLHPALSTQFSNSCS